MSGEDADCCYCCHYCLLIHSRDGGVRMKRRMRGESDPIWESLHLTHDTDYDVDDDCCSGMRNPFSGNYYATTADYDYDHYWMRNFDDDDWMILLTRDDDDDPFDLNDPRTRMRRTWRMRDCGAICSSYCCHFLIQTHADCCCRVLLLLCCNLHDWNGVTV